MTNYKAWRMPGIGEKPRWVIVDETEKIINKNPTKDELKELKTFPKEKRDNKYSSSLCDICNRPFEEAGHGTHYKEKIEQQWTGKYICHKCYMKVQNDKPDSSNNIRKELYRLAGKSRERAESNCVKCCRNLDEVTVENTQHPMREYLNGEWTGHWLCYNCWYHLDYKHRPDTTHKIIKSMRDRRLGTLHDPGNILGDNCEELTKRIFEVKRLSIENDKYSRLPNDHSPIPEGVHVEIAGKLVDLSCKIPQTTGRKLDSYGTWDFGNLQREWNKDFDIEICWCISKDGLNVERGYIFWKKYIYDSEKKEGIDRIHITKNPTDAHSNPIIPKYEMSRITDETFIDKADEKWKEIIKYKQAVKAV